MITGATCALAAIGLLSYDGFWAHLRRRRSGLIPRAGSHGPGRAPLVDRELAGPVAGRYVATDERQPPAACGSCPGVKASGHLAEEIEAFHLDVHRDRVAAEPIVRIADEAAEIHGHGLGRVDQLSW